MQALDVNLPGAPTTGQEAVTYMVSIQMLLIKVNLTAKPTTSTPKATRRII